MLIGLLFGLFFVGAFESALAQNSDQNTSVARLFSSDSDVKFLVDYKNLSIEERNEVATILQTEMASWKSLHELPVKLLESPDEKTLGLKKSLISWLREAPDKSNDLSNLKYLGLGQYPVESKIKLEKGECIPKSDVFAERSEGPRKIETQNYMCAFKTKHPNIYYGVGVPYLIEKYFSYSPCKEDPRKPASAGVATREGLMVSETCDRQLKVSLAIVMTGDPGVLEEVVSKSSTEHFIREVENEESWLRLKKTLWIALERMFTRLPSFSKTLPQRVRLSEVLSSNVDEKQFLRFRKLALFSNAVDESYANDACALVSVFYDQFTETPTSRDLDHCPNLKNRQFRSLASTPQLKLPPAAVVHGSAVAIEYHREMRKTIGDTFTWLQRVNPKLGSVDSELFKKATAFIGAGITSELVAKIVGLENLNSEHFDFEGESARVVVESLKDPMVKKNLAKERDNSKMLVEFWEFLDSSLNRVVSAEDSELVFLKRVHVNARSSRAVYTELDRRLGD